MFNGYDFVFDGKSSISENVKMLYTDVDVFEYYKGIPEKEISLFTTSRTSKWEVSGIKHEEPLSFPISIMIHSDDQDFYLENRAMIKRNTISRITHWLFDSTNFKRFQIISEEMKDLYFMAIFKDVEYFEAGGDVCGFRATVLCDTIGAYEDKAIYKSCSGITTLGLQCLHDGIYEVTPTYKIKLTGTAVSITVNDKTMQFKSLTEGSTITVDTETLIVTSDANDNLYVGDRFNLIFPTFHYGKNTITVDGDCELEIDYKLIREVGC